MILSLLLVACATKEPQEIPDSGETASECAEGFSGEDCSFCTWESAGAACHPMETAELYDLATIQNLSLEELRWQATESVQLDGVTAYIGDFLSSPFPAVNANGDHVEAEMRSKVAVYIPEGWPATANPTKGLVYAAHDESNVDSAVAAGIAAAFGMPVLYHGEYSSNWTELGFPNRQQLSDTTIFNMLANNTCTYNDLIRGNYYWSLAQADMRGITLLQRLAEQLGGQVDSVALRGFSKEGAGAWIASLVDDRIEVASPGGWPLQDRFEAVESNIAPYGCEGDSEGELNAAAAALGKDWFLHTPGGAAFINGLMISDNIDQLKARVLLIDGDVHMPGMHDGGYYMLGPEAAFLDELTVPWRYVRKALLYSDSDDAGGDEVSTGLVPVFAAEMLTRGAGSVDDYYPKVQSEEAELTGSVLTFTATTNEPTEAASIWWSWSDDRVWNEPEQASWTELEMSWGDQVWTAQLDLQAEGRADKVIGWYAEARNTVEINGAQLVRGDAAPVRFVQEPVAMTCELDPTDFCAE